MKRAISLFLSFLMLQGIFCFMLLLNAKADGIFNEELILVDGTPIKLVLNKEMSSKTSKTGELVDFKVIKDVKLGEFVVIPRGTMAIGKVVRAKKRRRLGRSGKLDITLDTINLPNGQKVGLRATKESSGKSRNAAMTGAIVASGILFFPAAPFFLFMKGKSITLPRGTEVTAYAVKDTKVDASSYPNLPKPEELTMKVTSLPAGADIMLNGDFVGNTPSTIKLETGDNVISVQKKGFKTWQKLLSLTSGSEISLKALLEKGK